MFVLSQSILIVLIAAAIGAFLMRVFMMGRAGGADQDDALVALRQERDELKRQLANGASQALNDAILTRKNAALEAELAELRMRADELAAANAKLRDVEPVDEDIAALKWRNKYLEARVLFFEGRDGDATVDVPPMPETMTTTRLTRSVDDHAEELLARLDDEDEAGATAAPAQREVAAEHQVKPARKVRLSNANFVPSSLADLSPEALERLVAEAGPGKPPARSRRRANPDDLLAIDGVGPKNQAWLNEQGIYYYYQIATMTAPEIAWLANNLPAFGSRVYRENWVAQCTALARQAA